MAEHPSKTEGEIVRFPLRGNLSNQAGHSCGSMAIENSLIFLAARDAARGKYHLPQGNEAQRDRQIDADLARIRGDAETTRALLLELFPSGTSKGREFYTRLGRFRANQGFSNTTERAVEYVWIQALKSLTESEREELLAALEKTGHEFFQIYTGLSGVVDTVPLRPGFVIEWFPALVRRLGDDGANAPVWNAIQRYSAKYSSEALGVISEYLRNPQLPMQMQIAEQMLGVLRYSISDPAQQQRFRELEDFLVDSHTPEHRYCYLRSFSATAWGGKFERAQLHGVLAQADAAPHSDTSDVIRAVCNIVRVPTLDDECFLDGLDWLQKKAAPDLPPETKHAIIVTFLAVVDRCEKMPKGKRPNLAALIARLFPLGKKYLGTWEQIEQYLLKVLRQNSREFEELISSLAETHDFLVDLVRSDKVFASVVSELQNGKYEEFVGRLVFTGSVRQRQFGLVLFEQLGLNEFPKGLLDKVGERDLRIALFAFQAYGAHGEMNPRFLLALATRFESAGHEPQKEFAEELLTQCKNYPRFCLGLLTEEKKNGKIPKQAKLVLTAIERAESYFVDRSKVRMMAANGIQVPGFRRIAERKWRTWNREIDQAARERSVFAQLIRTSEMLYGNSFAAYQNGSLSGVTPMGEHSIPVEFPSLELIAPEQMALRRFHALRMIDALARATE
jgi:hypothetical protein